MPAAITSGSIWTCLRPIGRGASGAVVSLAADDASGEVFVVKSAGGGAAKQQLRREWSVMLGLSSPHVVGFLGYRSTGDADDDDDRQLLLFLEFAPGGSLADMGRLEEGAIRAYAADMVKGLDYLHQRSIVHGDVKGSNVLLGADSRAKLADFGCARVADGGDPDQRITFDGTPAFMAPEVARGEAQGTAADIWALGCTVIEMATGRPPWMDTDNVLAVVRRVGFTDAVPEVPPWLSPEAKDFLNHCLRRTPVDRSTAAQLLHHPFVSTSACRHNKQPAAISTDHHWVSPTSALDAALWESEEEEEEDYKWNNSPVSRIRAMACSAGTLPEWDDDDQGWIQVGKMSTGNDDDDDVAAQHALRAVFSVGIGVGENLVKRQENAFVSLSCCSDQIIAVDAMIEEECSSFSYYLRLLSLLNIISIDFVMLCLV